ncbi:MAG: hypothetical protein AAB209_06855 [Bacteroidota bacterium]
MGKLNLDEIQPGMVLAADVLDRNGRVLLKNGLEITTTYLMILKQWGITDADIQGISREEMNAKVAESLDKELLAKTEAEFQEVFLHADRQHSFNQELFRLSVLRAVHKKMGVSVCDN